MEFQVKLTREAQKKYTELKRYLDDEFGDKVTNEFRQKLEQCFRLISKNPHLFPILDEEKEIRRAVVIKEVSVYFRIKENVVQILTILRGRNNQ